jgi:hypothetical protein
MKYRNAVLGICLSVTVTMPALAVDETEKPVKFKFYNSPAVIESSSGESAAPKEQPQETAPAKILQGYIQVVPSGTKIPMIIDTAIDSDTSQEGDELSARTSEDLVIDGKVALPAGSIVKGRIATLNEPKTMNRSGSIAIKFDSVTTPDNKQVPLVATIVAKEGVIHARRGMKDIAIDMSAVAAPLALGLGIGALVTNSSSDTTSSNSMSRVQTAAIGGAIGLAVGAIVLCAKKGKKVEVRPGDEIKIELVEDLSMPGQ